MFLRPCLPCGIKHLLQMQFQHLHLAMITFMLPSKAAQAAWIGVSLFFNGRQDIAWQDRQGTEKDASLRPDPIEKNNATTRDRTGDL